MKRYNPDIKSACKNEHFIIFSESQSGYWAMWSDVVVLETINQSHKKIGGRN
jgi:hypothetical protein